MDFNTETSKFDGGFVDSLRKALEEKTGRTFDLFQETRNLFSDTYWFQELGHTVLSSPLEFRINICAGRITVSRVQLYPQRSGVYTYIMGLVETWAREHFCSDIIVQSVCTEAMASWCEKNNYLLVKSTAVQLQDFTGGDYRLKLN